MITNELLSFIKEALAKGTTEEDVGKMLKDNGGWDDADIREAFDAIGIYSSTYQGAVTKAFQSGGETIASALKQPEEKPQPVRITPITIKQPESPPEQKADMQSFPQVASVAPSGPNVQLGNMHDRLTNVKLSPVYRPQPQVSVSPIPPNEPSQLQQGPSPTQATFATSAPGVGNAFAAARGISTQKAAPDTSFSAIPPIASPADNNQFLKSFAAQSEIKTKSGKVAASPGEKSGKGHGFLYFLLFIFILLALLGGAGFAYLKGFIPGISLPFVDAIGAKFPDLFPTQAPQNTVRVEGDDIVIGEGSSNEDAAATPAGGKAAAVEYYNDRIFIALPAASPASVTTLASTIAGELRGRVETCSYSIGNNGCVIITPVQTEAELEAIVLELSDDERITGAERVAIPGR